MLDILAANDENGERWRGNPHQPAAVSRQQAERNP